MISSFSRLSLLWKILLSTSVAITLLFALTGWIVLRNAIQTTSLSVEHEVGALSLGPVEEQGDGVGIAWPVTNLAGVTSNAGFRARAPSGATGDSP